MKKILFIILTIIIAPVLVNAQTKVNSNGDLLVGSKANSLVVNNNVGDLLISEDGMDNALTFYDTDNTSSSFRIYRSGSYAYLIRGRTEAYGIKMDLYGKVGIGRTPSYKLDVNGTIRFNADFWTGGIVSGTTSLSGSSMPVLYPASNWYGMLGTSSKKFGAAYIDHLYYDVLTDYSDKKIKENIRDIDDIKEKIKLLRPVKYDIKEEFYDSIPEEARAYVKKKGKNNVGLIAQEVREVFPDLVVLDESNGVLGVNYIDLIPYLLAMVQEQQDEIEKQEVIIEDLVSTVKDLDETINSCCDIEETATTKSGTMEELTTSISQDILNSVVLEQNAPNPFSETTTISMYITEGIVSATLYVYDINGNPKTAINITERGTTSVNIEANTLSSGLYLYTLICDGELISTKQMVVTE